MGKKKKEKKGVYYSINFLTVEIDAPQTAVFKESMFVQLIYCNIMHIPK